MSEILITTATFASPVGALTLFGRDERLCGLAFAGGAERLAAQLRGRFGAVRFADARDPAGAVAPLRAYFDGELAALDRIAVDCGGSAFQVRVWAALRDIPVGATRSYGELARAVGDPAAVRAVGGANHANPVAIVVPCHRVIASDGKLHGYGGGLERKQWLLRHERALLL